MHSKLLLLSLLSFQLLQSQSKELEISGTLNIIKNNGATYVGNTINNTTNNYYEIEKNKKLNLKIEKRETDTGIFEGYIVNGKYEGKGTFRFKDGYRYVGNFRNGYRDGFGVMYAPNGVKDYIGEWRFNDRSGYGVRIYENGAKFTGEFLEDSRDGLGIFTHADGSSFTIANYDKGDEMGDQIIEQFKTANVTSSQYVGSISSGKGLYDGYGTLISYTEDLKNVPGCRTYVGNFSEGLKHGLGTCYDKNDKLIYYGKFRNDYPIEKAKKIKLKYSSYTRDDGASFSGYVHKKLEYGLANVKLKDGAMVRANLEEGKMSGYFEFIENDGTIKTEFYEGKADGLYILETAPDLLVGGELKNSKVTKIISNDKKGVHLLNMENGKKNGYGMIMLPDDYDINYCERCKIFIGNFKNDLKNGYGTCYDREYNLLYDGDFINDRPAGEYPSQ